MAQQAAADQQRTVAEQVLQGKMALLKKGMTIDEVEGVIGPLPAGFRERLENQASSMNTFKDLGMQVEDGAYARVIMGRYELTFDSQGKFLAAQKF